jgi:ribonuclease HII
MKRLKDSLIEAGFTTIDFICRSTTTNISEKLRIDLYVAQIIFEEAKRMRNVVATTTTTTNTIDAASIIATVNKDNDYNNNKHTYIHNAYAYHILVHNHSPRITL